MGLANLMWNFLASIGSGVVAKFLGMLGDSFLKPYLAHLQSKEEQSTKRQGIWSSALKHAVSAETERLDIVSKRHIAMKDVWWYILITLGIMSGPIVYVNLVFLDTIFQFEWDVAKAPDRFEELAFDLIRSWIYGGGATVAVTTAAKIWNK